jgi:hypothetical protein
LFHDFINWIREDLGRFTEDGQSWSHQLHESLFMWNIIEGTHVLTIMFFAGTIWMIDLRMMGIAFKNMPLSKLSDRILPITIISMVAMVITGLIAFIGRDPLMYYHNIWFRLKMVFLIAAMINIVWFHYRVQKSDVAWDVIPPMSDPLPVKKTLWLAAFIGSAFVLLVSFLITGVDVWLMAAARTALFIVSLGALFMLIHKRTPGLPLVVKASGALSMLAWFLVIIFGRFIAYDWFYCEKETTTPGSLIYVLQECDSALAFREGGEEMIEEEVIEEEAPAEDAVPDGEAPAEEAPADGAPAEDAAPAQPTPGQGD